MFESSMPRCFSWGPWEQEQPRSVQPSNYERRSCRLQVPSRMNVGSLPAKKKQVQGRRTTRRDLSALTVARVLPTLWKTARRAMGSWPAVAPAFQQRRTCEECQA